MAAETVSGNLIALNLFPQLVQYRDRLNIIKTVPNIAAYAQEQEDAVGYDVVAEFNAMVAAIQSVIDWIIANFPSDGTYILKDELSTNGIAVRQFTPAQTAGLRTEIATIIASID